MKGGRQLNNKIEGVLINILKCKLNKLDGGISTVTKGCISRPSQASTKCGQQCS